MSASTAHLESCIRQACLIECRSIKPGNVSPHYSFDDASVSDFEQSAQIIAPILANTVHAGVGQTILDAVSATRAAVSHNTNLGIVLLLAPLAKVEPASSLRTGIGAVLDDLTTDDAIAVYEAIRTAKPGGLGDAKQQDVAQVPTMNLKQCMALAADRDLIAAQYVNDFDNVLEDGITLLQQTAKWETHHEYRIAWVAVSLIAKFGDTLIRRKCGDDIETVVRQRAQKMLNTGWPSKNAAKDTAATTTGETFRSFDEFLRADGNRRNPGTTADMIAAIIFAALRDGICTADADQSHLIFSDVDT